MDAALSNMLAALAVMFPQLRVVHLCNILEACGVTLEKVATRLDFVCKTDQGDEPQLTVRNASGYTATIKLDHWSEANDGGGIRAKYYNIMEFPRHHGWSAPDGLVLMRAIDTLLHPDGQ